MSGISASAKNGGLSGMVPNYASLHTDFPGVVGANECSGGGYAQQAISISAPSGGQMTLLASVVFNVSSQTVRWIGYWSGTTYLYCAPNGGAVPKNFTALPSTDFVVCPGHGYASGATVAFFNGTPPGGLTEGTIYYVSNPTTDQFQVSATLGGSVIDLTAASSFGCVVCAITETVHAASGQHTLSASTIVIPD